MQQPVTVPLLWALLCLQPVRILGMSNAAVATSTLLQLFELTTSYKCTPSYQTIAKLGPEILFTFRSNDSQRYDGYFTEST